MKNQLILPAPLRVAVYSRYGTDPHPPRDGEPVKRHANRQTLLTAGCAGQIEHLIAESFTSLGRNTNESLDLLRELRAAGVRVSLLGEGRVV